MESVIDRLQQENIPFQYTFTDISPLFLHEASKKFTKGVSFAVFNIENDPIGQGFSPEEFDVIIATNVIHATADIRQTLRNLNLVLRNNGLLIIAETFKEPESLVLTFGLLDGWWRFTDDRKSSPLCAADRWKLGFEQEGFDEIETKEIFGPYCGTVAGRKVKNGKQEESDSNSWLFVSDESELENILKEKMKLAGRKCLEFSEDVPQGLEGIMFLWTSPTVYEENQFKCQQLLHFCQKFVAAYQDSKIKPKFILVTRGVYYLGDAGPGNPNSSTSTSFVRTWAHEHPDFNIASVDLDQDEQNPEREATELFAAICSKEKEMFKAIREDKVFMQRLVALNNKNLAIPLPNSNRFKIVNPPTKSINDLQISVAPRIEPVEDEVEVAIRATALNFRDLFVILRPEGFDLPDDIISDPGLDIAGIVSAVGPKCSKFQIGDEVFGYVPGGGLASHVVASSQKLIRKPKEMTFTSAATIPVAFLTVYYSFHECAKLAVGESVLIHVATGGVGLAAIQMANIIGAEIFATAGSKRKRAYLRSIGIKHVYHSRNTDFGEEILRDTNGAGVNVVLNSLTGPNFKEASLKTCAQGGRFVEIGKVNTFTAEEVKSLRPDVKYFLIELSITTAEKKEELDQLYSAVEQEFEKGIYKGLPHDTFSLDMIREAFFYFQEAKHIGKIVVTIPEPKVSPDGKIYFQNNLFNSQSTYLITGGLGGIGIEVAKWMTKLGAQNIVLVGRNPPTNSCQEVLNQMNAGGCRVLAVQADISAYEECETLLQSIVDLNFPPLRGIMHAAGVLSDGIVMNQSWDKFEAVFPPKVKGTWNLHKLTTGYDLQFFTMFSSMVAILGLPGQSNHAAANRFLDSFTHYRNSIGLPANSINFGPWSDIGVAANLKAAESGILGIRYFTPSQGLNSIERILRTQRRHVMVAEICDSNSLRQLCRLGNYFNEMKLHVTQSGIGLEAYKAIIDDIKNSAPETRQEKIEDFLEKAIKETLRIPENEQLDRDQNFSEIGVDSLMAMELRNRLQGMLGDKQLTVSALQENRTIRTLSAHMAHLMNPDASVVSVEDLVAKDLILDPEIRPTSKPASKPSEFKDILLTGATGHLGVNLIPMLQNENPNLTIHCIVRGKNSEEVESRLKETLQLYSLLEKVNFQKIRVFAGDLSKTSFNLPAEEYKELAEKIDAVLHCAVKSNHLEEYNSFGEGSLRSNNVGATVNILRFACTGNTKPVLYASSLLAATSVADDGSLAEDFPTVGDVGSSIKNGYTLSKFVSENLMSQASERGIPVTVVRYASIFGNSLTGFVPTEKNHVWGILSSCIRVRKFPTMGQNGIPIMAVDTAAQVTAQIFLRDSMETGVYNLTSSSSISEEGIASVFSKYGIEGEFVTLSEWRDLVFEELDKNELGPFVSLYGDDEKTQTLSYLGVHPLANQISALKFNSVSDKLRRNCPDFEKSIVPIDKLLGQHLEYHYELTRKH